MVLTDEQRDEILVDFINIFKSQYGENWKHYLTSPLKPSPVEQIAQQRNVKKSDVRRVRRQLLLCGQLLEWYQSITSA